MRIELRQIGVRDEARMIGGLGPCGRQICCGAFLDEFQPVSIKMAKEQNLSLNPTKISGVCGRLMCCLKYEQEHYEMTRKKMPKIGRDVITPDGTGPVTDLNIVKETVFVRLTNGDTSEIKEYPLEAITRPQDSQQRPEPARKQPAKEEKAEKPDIPEIGEETEEEISEEIFEETTVFAESAPAAPERDRNRDRNRKAVLGQPVRRQNPNRTDLPAAAAAPEAESKPAAEPAAPAAVPAPATDTGTKGSWADALEKAIQAISQDK